MTGFLKKLLCRFIKPKVIADADDDITKIDTAESNQLEDDKVYIGLLTKGKLQKLLGEGDISSHLYCKFIQGVKAFYITVVTYALTNLPLEDEVLRHAQLLTLKED